ncbi:MAG: EF-P lysine aminoacylase GenX [Alphaproteobacteria bacterium]|nr:EF-P lysine aminoacylase GenX [Alphaproteobacteria bacterium]
MDGKEWWRPEVFARRRANLKRRQAVLADLRAFFAARDFDEVETPILQVAPGCEPHLAAFATRLVEPLSGGERTLWLHTSPEFAMKKLLAAGLPRIFQLARTFRNGERSPTHHPEFTMLEWYRAGEGWLALMDDCEALLREVARGQPYRRGDITCDPNQPARRLSVAEAFGEWAGIDLMSTISDAWAPEAAPLAAKARRLGLHVGEDDSWDDVFFRVMFEFVEPRLGIGVATILHSWPVSMAALSRPEPADPRVAQRFELYVCGVELANAFGELTDPAEQRRRFEADMEMKERLYGLRWPIDEDLLAALEAGLPDCAGIALGVDRLVMLACGAEDIGDVLWAPVAAAG